MAGMRKSDIKSWAMGNGGPLEVRDVARVSRDSRTITLRHAWPDDVDARVWDVVRSAFMRGARTVLASDARVRRVQVFTHDGNLLEEVNEA